MRNFNTNQEAEEPEVLYHYTTQTGLLGILDKKCLWASKIQHLNDSSELRLAMELADEVIREDYKGEEVLKKTLLTQVRPLLGVNVCVASLSTEGDLLSQWRAYGGDGVGFSLGFRKDALSEVASEQGFELVKCIYSRAEQKSTISAKIEDVLKVYPEGYKTQLAESGKDPALECPGGSELQRSRAEDFARYAVKEGDVLFTRSGTVGRCSIVPRGFDGSLMTFHLLRARPSQSICLSEILLFAFQGAPAVLEQISSTSVGATRAGFNTKLLEGIWLPLPPPAEQSVLVGQVVRVLSQAQDTLASIRQVESSLLRVDQSILAKAFRGELVPQDPNDEPADLLLDRIRAERAVAKSDKPKRRRGSL